MVDENQNSEMEDILSSIKNILEEGSSGINASSDNTNEDVLVSANETDDVLELSQDMRIETNVAPHNEPEQSVQPLADITPEVEFALDQPEGDMSPVSIISEADEEDSFFDADNFSYKQENASTEETFDDSFMNTQENETANPLDIDIIPATETDDSLQSSEIKPEEPEDILASVIEDTTVDSPIVAEPADFEPAIQETVAPEPAPVQKEADASSNIISNFAKMFSREEKKKEVMTPVEENIKITSAGTVEKTLEEFVLDAIIKTIGNEIKASWNEGKDFRAYAEAEINRQVSAWVKDNLPSQVENIVKQEIQRVIAKVGS